jgi:ferredoxin-NADP reductase
MAHQFFDSKVLDIIDETEQVKRFIIEFNKDIPLNFRAGQFVMINMPIPAKITHRSYSIASAPCTDNVFELVIVLNPQGLGTPWMWENLKPGSVVPVSKPLGKFGLPVPLDQDICFVCTGVGIAPFRSMAWDIFNKDTPHKNIYMVFGTRHISDILYRNEMEELAGKHPEFKYIPTLSREGENWTGRKGYVHQAYEELFSDRRTAYFYLCGWNDMLNEARKRIADMGYEKKLVKFETYD